VETIDRIIANQDRMKNLEVLDDLCELMLDGSLCALGGLTPYPVLSAVQHFPEDFDKAPSSPGATPPPAQMAPKGQETQSWR
jgi:formate dehydrogenase iron-sulfur subunit